MIENTRLVSKAQYMACREYNDKENVTQNAAKKDIFIFQAKY